MTIWEYGAIALFVWGFGLGAAAGAISVYVWTQLPAKPIRQYRQKLLAARIRIRARQAWDSITLRNHRSRRTR